MALTRTQKEEVVAKLKGIVERAQTVVFVNFHGLGVSDTNEMRSNLREQGVGYLVAKKSLIRNALGDAKVEGEVPALDGEVAVAYGEADPVAPASGVATFAKKHKESLSILGGIFEGRLVDQAEMETIAAIPPLPVLHGMFVNVINSPIQGLAVALSEIAKTKE